MSEQIKDPISELVESLSWLVQMFDDSPLMPSAPESEPLERLLWVLEYQATAEPVPPCRVCGGPLTIGSMGGGARTQWGCQNVKIGEEGWSDHYAQSKWSSAREGDEKVLALVRYVRATAAEAGGL